MAFRAGGAGPFCSECCPDPARLDFVWRLGELAAAGRDPQELIFRPNTPAPSVPSTAASAAR